MAPRRSTKTSSRASVASASRKVAARSAPTKLATAAHAKESKWSLRVVCEVSSRIVKKAGFKFKRVARKLIKTAQRIWDEHQKDLDVMDLDTKDDHEKYDILEKIRLLITWFEYLSSPKGFASFDNSQSLKELKAHLEEALDLLDLPDPDTVNVNDLWNFSHTHSWQQFLEGNAQTKEQKEIKKDVDKILEILCERQKTGNCFSNLLLAHK